MRKLSCILFVLASVFLMQCQFGDKGIVIPVDPYVNLSEYDFFIGDLSDLEPSPRVLPYDLNSPLFSDYAHKARFVWLPEGVSAGYNTDHVLDFPIGSVLIKNFYYNHDERDLSQGRRIIETRLLINRGEEWDAWGYIWNDEQTDATYDVIGGIKDVAWINELGEHQKVDYIIPNKNQCKGCHAYKNKLQPIGPKVRNLNKEYAYTEGTSNQLSKWADIGYLKGFTDFKESPSVAVWNHTDDYDLHSRALAYLDINCGHCHNPDGAANTSGLTLMADSEIGTSLGVYKATVSAGAGTGGYTYSIVPGNPEESVMIYRMNSLDPGAMMPEIGRRVVHHEGVALIADWIKNMRDLDM